MGTHYNRLTEAILMSTHTEAILMSTHNIHFYGEITKIIPKLSSNTLLNCFTDFWYSHSPCFNSSLWLSIHSVTKNTATKANSPSLQMTLTSMVGCKLLLTAICQRLNKLKPSTPQSLYNMVHLNTLLETADLGSVLDPNCVSDS